MYSEKYNILVHLSEEDFNYVRSQYIRLGKTLFCDKFYFIGNREIECKLEKSANAYFIDEDKILSFDRVCKFLSKRLYTYNRCDIALLAKAYYKLFVKFSYASLCEDEYYVVWDINNIPCGSFSLFSENGIPYIDVQNNNSEQYFKTIKKLIPGIGKVIAASFITGHMTFQKDIVKEIISKIEVNNGLGGDTYWEKILNSMDDDELLKMSFNESELYGSYCALFYPGKYQLRECNDFRYGSDFFDIDEINERDLKWLSKDYATITFRNNEGLKKEYKNIFNNPKYQEKLTPKQMLETVLGVFDGDGVPTAVNKDHIEKIGMPSADNIEPDEYMTYYVMGKQLLKSNINQAYLCLENAEFLCEDEELSEIIKKEKEDIRSNDRFNVKKTAFIILSYNELYFTQDCLESIWKKCAPGAYEIVVVDNASSDGSREWLENCPYDIKLVLSDVNLGFPGGCNAGIKKAENDSDILLLNNDTRLCHNSLFWLRMGLYENDHIGAVSSISSYGGNNYYSEIIFDFPDEYVEYGSKVNIPMKNPYEEKLKLEGFALLIERRVLEKIGYLDEAFTPGYLEDDDICYRIHREGYRMNICHNSYIYHAGSQSFRKVKNVNDIEIRNREYFIKKWNIDNMNFKTTNLEYKVFKDFISGSRFFEHFKMLEIGSGCGNFLSGIQYYFPNSCVYGIERDKNSVENSIESVHTMLYTDNLGQLPFQEKTFDYILISDRMGDKEQRSFIEKEVHKYLKETGKIYI